jgi:CysZ protein
MDRYGTAGAPPEAAAPGFGAGVVSLFSGLRFIVTTPSAWPLALVPVAVVILVAIVVGALGFELLPRWIEPLLGSSAHKAHGALKVVVKVLVAALSVVVGTLLGFILAQPLSGTALEKIVRRVEATMGVPPWPETSLLQEIWRSIEGLLLITALSLPLLGTLFFISFIFPPAAIVTMPLKVLVTAVMLAWDLCDYPLSIRGMAIRPRIALLRRHLVAVLGFGLGLSLLCLIPCGLLLALPVGAAGATRLIVQIERWESRNQGYR